MLIRVHAEIFGCEVVELNVKSDYVHYLVSVVLAVLSS